MNSLEMLLIIYSRKSLLNETDLTCIVEEVSQRDFVHCADDVKCKSLNYNQS